MRPITTDSWKRDCDFCSAPTQERIVFVWHLAKCFWGEKTTSYNSIGSLVLSFCLGVFMLSEHKLCGRRMEAKEITIKKNEVLWPFPPTNIFPFNISFVLLKRAKKDEK